MRHRERDTPPWVVVVAILLCIGGGGLITWWFLGDKDEIIETVPQKPRELMVDHQRFLSLARDDLYDTARELLKERPDLVNSRDPDSGGATLLHAVAWEGDVEAATILIDAGADLEATDDRYKSTPLGWAVVAGRADVVELLLKQKAVATPSMGKTVVEGINGNLDFAPGTPDDYRRIAELLRAQGIVPEPDTTTQPAATQPATEQAGEE